MPNTTTTLSYLNKMKSHYLSHQQPQQPQQQQPSNFHSSSINSKSNHEVNKQIEREKFFADYIKNNGDAATNIIPNFLYLGGHRSVNNINTLISDRITHILNMASELKLDVNEMTKHNIKLLHISAKDAKTYNIRFDFDRAFHFIDDCLKSRGKIIINCARGISRSATIVIGYLMFRYSMTLLDAYKFIISLRPQVRPNSYFRKQLELYEQELIFNRYKMQLKSKAAAGNTSQAASQFSMASNTPRL